LSIDPHEYARVLQSLVPRPRTARVSNGRFQITNSTRLQVYCGDCARSRFAAERFSELVKDDHGVGIVLDPKPRPGPYQLVLSNSADEIVMCPVLSEQPEGYVLHVYGDAAVVASSTAQGLFWGAMTLRQLVLSDEDGIWLPGVCIEDWPRYQWRGFMVDSGRSPNSLAKIKRVIRICSSFKLNFMVFREGDDELSSVRYRSNRLGSGNPYAFTPDQVRDMIEYAARYGITVIPEVESLGHSTAKGLDYPDLVSGGFEHKYGDLVTHIRKSHLAPADPRSYELLESVYDEWFSLLGDGEDTNGYERPRALIHLGLDEVRLDPEPQARHLEGLLRTVDRVGTQHGIEAAPIVWADAPPTPPEFADRVIRCLWHYGDTKDKVNYDNAHLIRQGLRELTEGHRHDRVFMAAGSGSGHTPYSKSDYPGAFENLAQWAAWGRDLPNFIGLLAVQWSGNMLDDWLPDFAEAAEVSWNPPDEVPDFEPEFERVKAQLARLKDAASPCPDEVDPPAWDGIFLKNGEWYHDIMSGTKAED
jgi:hypothetical protein